MINNIEKIFKGLVLGNSFISVIITVKIFYKNNYNLQDVSWGLLIMVIYALIWFYSLYKIYNFSRFGLKIYISLTILGFLFNIISNLSYADKSLFLLTLSEHLIIGSLITFSFFTKVKLKFK